MVTQIVGHNVLCSPGRLWRSPTTYALRKGYLLTTRARWIELARSKPSALRYNFPALRQPANSVPVFATNCLGATRLGPVPSIHNNAAVLDKLKVICASLRFYVIANALAEHEGRR